MRLPIGTVAGVDLALGRIEDAENAAHVIADGITAQGIAADRLVVGVHRVLVNERDAGDFALSVAVQGMGDDTVWRLVRESAAQAAVRHEPTVVMRGRRCGPGARAATARLAATEQANGTGGRAVVFRGSDAATGSWMVRDLLAGSAIEEVVDIEASTPKPEDLVLVSESLRPRWSFGKLVLFVLPAPGLPDSIYLPFQERQRQYA